MKKFIHIFLAISVVTAAYGLSLLWKNYKTEKRTAQIMSAMTLKQKIGQLFMVGNLGKNITQEKLFAEYHFGNIFLGYADINELNSTQIGKLTRKLQELSLKYNSNIPLFIATDQEGGKVNRVKHGVTRYPSQEFIGTKTSPQSAEKVAFSRAVQLNAIGINTNFSPVLDVNTNKLSHIAKYGRSFSGDPQKVTEFTKAYLKGYKKANVIGCAKHFPGYGDVSPDPHKNLPATYKTYNELYKCELYPYRKLLSKIDMIMTAHITLPEITKETLPATISKEVIQDILREKFGYNGVIITDDFNMGAMGKKEGLENLSIMCINAGVDIILLVGRPGLQKELWNIIYKAVKENIISEERLNESVRRIIKLKVKYGLFDKKNDDSSTLESKINTKGQRALYDSISNL